MGVTLLTQRARNFAVPREGKCMNCGKSIWPGKGIYEKRFCSIDCKEDYCGAQEKISIATV
jgi:hypothetical protein